MTPDSSSPVKGFRPLVGNKKPAELPANPEAPQSAPYTPPPAYQPPAVSNVSPPAYTPPAQPAPTPSYPPAQPVQPVQPPASWQTHPAAAYPSQPISPIPQPSYPSNPTPAPASPETITPAAPQNESPWKPFLIYLAVMGGVGLMGIILLSAESGLGVILLMLSGVLWLAGAYVGFTEMARKGYLGDALGLGCIFWLFLGWWMVGLLAAIGPCVWIYAIRLLPRRACPFCKTVIPGDASRCPQCQSAVTPIV